MLKRPDRHKWYRWMERISEELAGAAVDRHVFARAFAALRANPSADINSRLITLFWRGYLDRQVLVVRRQLRDQKGSISLAGLLKEVAEQASQLTRADFVVEYGSPFHPETMVEAQQLFDSFADPATPGIVSARKVEADLGRLAAHGRQLTYFADKYLAHSDRKRRWPELGFRHLNRCLGLLDRTWRRYHVLVVGGPILADPVWLAGTEWEQMLDIPWRRQRGRTRMAG